MENRKKTRKANGNGYTYKVGGSWKTVIEINGQKITATNKSQQESRRLAKERALKARTTNKGSIKGANKITLQQHLVPYLENVHAHNIADTTLVRYVGICKKYVLPALGHLPLHKITKANIADFRNTMTANGVGGRTINQALSAISVAFDGAMELGLVDNNIAKNVKKVAVNQKSITPLSEDEMLIMLNSSKGTFMHARLHIAFHGIRQGEALGLRWSQINLEKNEIQIVEQIQKVKGVPCVVGLKSENSERPIYFGSETANAIKAHKAILAKMKLKQGENWHEEDLVFPNKCGKPLSSKTDWRRWSALLVKNGIKHYRLHDARHTAGTLLFANGEDIETIKRVLGHSNINLTSRTYVHSSIKPIKNAGLTINNVISKSNQIA